jgi:putative ABC transport system permease protein
MLRNFLTIALRNFRRQPGYTFLNIFGLTIGMAATLFILLYITEETSFDTQHERADRIFRISSDITEPDDHFRWSVTQDPLAPTLKQDYPEVEEYVRFIDNGRAQFEVNDRFFFVEKTYIADSTVCDVFTFDFTKGDAKTALIEPNSIVLSQSVADRIFGKNDPIGATLKTSSEREYKVTGVYKDMPTHSHLIANAMISANTFPGIMHPDPGSWGGFNIYSYVLLKEGIDPASFAAKLPEVIEKYVAVIFDQFDIKVKYELLPLKSIHLTSDFEGEPEPTGQMGFLYIFGAVGLFLLLIAIINYMNLSTARATRRAMEVGVRKVLGSERKQLVGQFLSESVLFTLIALVLSFVLVHLLLPAFNATFDVTLGSELLWSKPVLLGALGIVLLTGFLGGSYPAFYLSSFEPMMVLKGSLASGTGNPALRKVLVTVQFAITLFMLIGTGIIYDQMNFLRKKDLGFDKEHVMTFQLQGRESRNKFPVIRDRLLQNPKISAIGTSTTSPGQGYGKNLCNAETSDGGMEQYGIDLYGVDYEFFPTLGVEFVAGRNFSKDYGTDSTNAVLINEAMAERFGWEEPIGKKFQLGTEDTLPYRLVVGVVKNFHQQSLYEPISPLLFFPNANNGNVHLRINPQNPQELSQTIAFVENEWNAVFPNIPFEFDFVDASFMELYKADQVRARIFTLFSILMILIACLGLLGLASFTAEQRTKEIGIRKVMGAQTSDIVYLLTRNFVLLVAVSTIPAFIAAWYFMTKWLDTFAYHTSMNYVLYGLAFFLVVLITILTTGYHALRAAQNNPVDSLKWE